MFPERPLVIVAAFIFNQDGKLFLMKSHKWKDVYSIPGGKVEYGEPLEKALIREVKEETNLDVEKVSFFILMESIFDPAFFQKKHFVFLDYTCYAKNMEVQLNEEAEEYVWVDPEEALSLPMNSYTRNALEKYLKDGKHQ